MKIFYYFQLIRFYNICIALVAVLLSSYLIDVYNVNVLLCLFIILFSMIFANTMNDILDLKTDNINHPIEF